MYTQGFLHTLLCYKNRYDFRDDYNKNDFRPKNWYFDRSHFVYSHFE